MMITQNVDVYAVDNFNSMHGTVCGSTGRPMEGKHKSKKQQLIFKDKLQLNLPSRQTRGS